MISKARAQQIRWVTWAFQAAYWIWFGSAQFGMTHWPSHLAKVAIFSFIALVYLLHGYALCVVGRWNKVESVPQGLKPAASGAERSPRLKPLGYLEATANTEILTFGQNDGAGGCGLWRCEVDATAWLDPIRQETGSSLRKNG
jgi:hypothetical protein